MVAAVVLVVANDHFQSGVTNGIEPKEMSTVARYFAK